MLRLLRYILGYVRFSVKGEFPERLFNQLSARNVKLWEMKRKNGVLTACISARNYLKMRKFKGKNRVCTRVLERHGLPFLIKRYHLRLGVPIGALLYIAILIFLSSFVWNIEVCGNETIETKKIISTLESLGLYEGVPLNKLDQEALRTRLCLEMDELAWASVNIEGSKVTVNVSEAIVIEKPSQNPCNLIASRDGIITMLEVTEGTTVAALGQTVKKGDLLVSGFTEYKDGTFSVGRSQGKIYAKTERELSVFSPFSVQEKTVLSKPFSKTALSVFGLDIPLYFGSVKQECEIKTEIKRFESNGMYLPITLTEAVFTPIGTTTVVLSRYEAEENAFKLLEKLEKTELFGVEIISSKKEMLETAEGICLTVKYVCRENIAKEDLLLIYEEE